MATSGKSINELRAGYPHYEMVKDKKAVSDAYDLSAAFVKVKAAFPGVATNEVDGLKLDFPDGWVHLRASNTEPIVRVYAEAPTAARAQELAGKVMEQL